MAKPDKAKMDKVSQQIQRFTDKLAKFQAKVDAINADGVVTPEEQAELDELAEAMTAFQAKIDKLTGIAAP